MLPSCTLKYLWLMCVCVCVCVSTHEGMPSLITGSCMHESCACYCPSMFVFFPPPFFLNLSALAAKHAFILRLTVTACISPWLQSSCHIHCGVLLCHKTSSRHIHRYQSPWPHYTHTHTRTHTHTHTQTHTHHSVDKEQPLKGYRSETTEENRQREFGIFIFASRVA